jgi:hypothetical protein
VVLVEVVLVEVVLVEVVLVEVVLVEVVLVEVVLVEVMSLAGAQTPRRRPNSKAGGNPIRRHCVSRQSL